MTDDFAAAQGKLAEAYKLLIEAARIIQSADGSTMLLLGEAIGKVSRVQFSLRHRMLRQKVDDDG